jgi:SWI/SNF chromatin-remodeling complex subunit SWI1
LDYELDKAAEKVICITTIFRNLSFFETNHPILSGADVVKFISRTIELLGSKKLFLRTHQNTLDFMKDIIIYLSNLAQAIEIPGIDEAANLLHVILAFAPTPAPAATGRDKLLFIPYQPSVHRYLAPAVDSFAKLLARDEPNRSHYKNLFLAESHTVPKYDLLTRSFALAISPIPDYSKPHLVLSAIAEARKPILEQGMLAAEILAGIAPGTDQGIAHEWLQSEDGFEANLLRLVVSLLSAHARPPPQHRAPQNQEEQQPFARITHRGMSVLQRLLDKCDPEFLRYHLPVGVMPKKENLLGALLTVQIEPIIIKQLCAYAGYDDV